MTTNCLDTHEKFIKLYELYYQDLLRYAISIVKSHSAAEELVHDAYVKILKRIEDIEEPASPVPNVIWSSPFAIPVTTIC